MVGSRRRLFTMNTDGLGVVCLFNGWVVRATAVNTRTQPRRDTFVQVFDGVKNYRWNQAC